MIGARQVRLVAEREVRTRIRTRAYQLSTLLLAALAVGGMIASQAVPEFFEQDPYRVALLPAAAEQVTPLEEAAVAFDRELEAVPYDDAAAAQAALVEGEIDAILVEPDQILFEAEPDTTLEAVVRQSLSAARLQERADALGLTFEEAMSLIAPVEVTSESAAPPVAEEDDGANAQGVGTLTAIVLLMALTFYGNWVLVGVIEEKSNRVVEILLAAVRPTELLVGKVLGILALAILQMAVAVVAFLGAAMAMDQLDALPRIALAGMGMAVLWLVLGLLLYNFLYAAVGATVNRPDEATSASMPLMIPIMGGYFAGLIVVPQGPDSLAARALSLFPLTAPLTMPLRVASGGGSPAEAVLAVALALGALVGIVWFAARVYSGGVLQASKVGLTTAFRRARDIR